MKYYSYQNSVSYCQLNFYEEINKSIVSRGVGFVHDLLRQLETGQKCPFCSSAVETPSKASMVNSGIGKCGKMMAIRTYLKYLGSRKLDTSSLETSCWGFCTNTEDIWFSFVFYL